MGMEIDFRTFDAFKTTVRDALPSATLSEGQLRSLEDVVAREDVTIHSVNRSKLSASEKAVAALLMLLRDTPGDAKLARVSSNLAEFFDRLVADKESTFARSLRTDALGSDPFDGWSPLRVQQIEPDSFALTDSTSGQIVQMRESAEGEIDVTEAREWTPDALKTVLTQLKELSAPSENALMQRFKVRLDELEGRVIQRAHAALTEVHGEKVKLLADSAKVVAHAVTHPTKIEYEVPQASIDVVGHALAAAADNPPPDEALQALASLPAFKEKVAASLAQLSDRDCASLVGAMERLSELADRQVSIEVVQRAGVSQTALALLTLFRAVEASLEQPAVHEAVRNQGSIREAAELLLATPALDAALMSLLKELSDPDPLGLQRGEPLHSSNAFNRDTQILGVHAVESEAGVSAYQIVTGAGTWTLDQGGVTSPESEATTPLGELSIEALRTLTTALLAASPDSVTGPLSWFRRTEERTKGGFSYAKLLENSSAALAEKMANRMAAIRDVVLALASLDAIRDQP